MDAEARMKELGIVLAEPPKSIGLFEPLIIADNMVYTSGHLPMENGEVKFKGKLGKDVSIEEGFEAARLCTINALAAVKGKLGSLNKIRKVVKVTGFVNSDPDFTDQPKVINGASKQLIDIFEEQGLHARSAIGQASLPLGAAVEVEFVFQVG